MSFTMVKSSKEEAVFTIEIDAKTIETAIMEEFKRVTAGKEQKKMTAPLSDKAMLAQYPELNKVASQALNNLLPSYYMDAIKKFGLTPMTYPKIRPNETKLGEPCLVEIRVALEPKIELKKYEGLAASYSPVIVTEEDVKQQIAGLRQQRGAENDDEKLLKTLPFDTIEAFTAEVRSSLQSMADEKTESNKREAVIKKLIEGNPLSLREEVVDQQIMLMINQFRQQVGAQNFDGYLKSKGMSINDAKKEVRPEAEETVRKNLLLAAVADKISPEITEEDIKSFILKQENSIQDMGLSYEARRKKLEATPGALEQLQQAIRMKKAADHILGTAVLKENEPVRILDQLPEYMK